MVEWKRGPWMVLGCPWTYKLLKRKKGWEDELAEFRDFCEENNLPCFTSQYWFTKGDPEAKKVDRNSAIVDCITFDIDGGTHKYGEDDPLVPLRKGIRWLDEQVIDYEIYYSGNEGFAIYIPFPETKLKEGYRVMRQLYERLEEKLDIAVDNGAMLGTQQKFRLNGSRHQKSKLYKVQLTHEEATTLTMEDMKEIARVPREPVYTVDGNQNEVLAEVCRRYDSKDYFKKLQDKSLVNYRGFFNSQKRLRPCTQMLIDQKVSSYDAMTIICFEMVWLSYPDKEIHVVMESLIPHKYNYNITQRQIDSIREKMTGREKFTIHGCLKIKHLGYCVNPLAVDIKECESAEKEKEREEAKRNLRRFIDSSIEE